jgi:secondary thiamine-phosphate synthase enzyme
MALSELLIPTEGENLINITPQIQEKLAALCQARPSGILYVFCTHTSCALTINEGFDPTAVDDMRQFLMHLARRDLPFIQHTTEGSDDSPSHMKTMLLQPSLTLIVENRKLLLGTWQGIYLAEFRDAPKKRRILLKYVGDPR